MLADESDTTLTPAWGRWDRLLMRALVRYEQSLCPDCQQDRKRSMNPDMSGEYEIKTHVCYCCSGLESRRAEKDRPKGVKDFVVDAGPPTESLMPYVIDLSPEGAAENGR